MSPRLLCAALFVSLTPLTAAAQVRITDIDTFDSTGAGFTESSWAMTETDGSDWFGASSTHQGLLGKTYLSGQYVHFSTDDPIFRSFADETSGTRVELNLPLDNVFDLPGGGWDLFGRLETFDFSGTLPADSLGSGSPALTMNLDWIAYEVGVNFYWDTLSPHFRPFAGIMLRQAEISLDLSTNGVLDASVNEDDGFAYYQVGAELDLVECLSSRTTLELNTDGNLRHVAPEPSDVHLISELILWCTGHAFLRGGIATDLEGNVGFVAGGGLGF